MPSSSSESGSDDDNNNQRAKRVGNAFAGLHFEDSDDSSDDSDDDETSEDAVQEAVATPTEAPTDAGAASSDSEDDDDDETITHFSDLVGRTTRHGTTLSAAFVEAVRRSVGGGAPTEIQRACWTALLTTSSRDVVAVSRTGSGKTLAVLVPLLAGLTPGAQDARRVRPRAIVLAPTRVLARQLYEVASELVGPLGLKVAAVLGGEAYHRQAAELAALRPDVLIATPGRLNSLCGRADEQDEPAVCVELDLVTELVVDEADLMLALGFRNDLDWFAHRLQQDAGPFRTVLTSATWGADTSEYAGRSLLSSDDPTVLGRIASDDMTVTKNVTQRVEVLAHQGAPRFRSLVQLLTAALGENNKNKMIVFCAQKAQARTMGKDLRSRSIDNVVLEGDMSQTARVAAVASFRDDAARRVLVATDVAARGLDVPHVTHVFNYELGKIGLESYVHRCGRTGRAGRFGVAHTFVLKSDGKLSPELVGVLRKTNQRVPDELRIMAGKELKRRSKVSSSSKEGGDSSGPNTKSAEEIADAVELQELREANREKQRRQNQNRSKKSKGGNNAKRGGRGRK